MCVCVGGRRREWEGEGWGWTHKLGLGLQREWEEETKVFTATQDRQTEASFTTTRKPSGFEAAIRSEVELSFQALTPSCAARTSRWFFSGEVGKKKKNALEIDSCRGRGVRRWHMQLCAGWSDEQTDHTEGLRGEAVRERVHQSSHFHLWWLPVETIHRGGLGWVTEL